MRICIIGSTSFLAKSIYGFCIKYKIDFLLIGRKKIEEPNINFIQIEDLDNAFPFQSLINYDVIFYCLASGVQSNINTSSDEVFKVNLFFPILLTERLKQLKYSGKLITFGSYFEIGNNSDDKLFTEIELLNSNNDVPNDYCKSKRLFTRYMLYANNDLLQIHFILPTVYGVDEQQHRLIPYLIRTFKDKEVPKLTSGTQVRQYIYVDDVVLILFSLLNKIAQSGVYNFFSAQTLTVREIALEISKYFNVTVSDDYFGKAERGDLSMQNLQLDSTKIKLIITQQPSLSTIRENIANYLNNEF